MGAISCALLSGDCDLLRELVALKAGRAVSFFLRSLFFSLVWGFDILWEGVRLRRRPADLAHKTFFGGKGSENELPSCIALAFLQLVLGRGPIP